MQTRIENVFTWRRKLLVYENISTAQVIKSKIYNPKAAEIENVLHFVVVISIIIFLLIYTVSQTNKTLNSCP